MRWGLITIAGATVVGLGVAIGVAIEWLQRPPDQFVTLTEKRHAELLDLQRRQRE